MKQVSTPKAEAKECPESMLITLAAANLLHEECPTDVHIQELITHIRQCLQCKNTLRFVISDEVENGTVFRGGRDKRLDCALQEDVV